MAKIDSSLVSVLITTGLTLALDAVAIQMEKEGRTEITIQDLENLRLEDPEDVIRRYQERRRGDPSTD